MPETMKAMKVNKNGVAELVHVPKPIPGKGEVLVKVICTAVDTTPKEVVNKTMTGYFTHKMTNPLILGWHFSGVIEALGDDEDDDNLPIGTSVWGHLQYAPTQSQGTFAEYVTVPMEDLSIKPEEMTHTVAGAMSTEAMTALQAMRDLGGLTSGGHVLILGAGGGVGFMAVQIAKRMGAVVTAVCGMKDIERVEAAGADVVIDRRKAEDNGGASQIFASKNTYDVVFDTPAKYSYRKAEKCLKKGGCFVTTLPNVDLFVGMAKSALTRSTKSCKFVEVKSNAKDLDLVGNWMKEKNFHVPIDQQRFRVANLSQALRNRGESSNKGYVVVDVLDGWMD